MRELLILKKCSFLIGRKQHEIFNIHDLLKLVFFLFLYLSKYSPRCYNMQPAIIFFLRVT